MGTNSCKSRQWPSVSLGEGGHVLRVCSRVYCWLKYFSVAISYTRMLFCFKKQEHIAPYRSVSRDSENIISVFK